MWLTRCPLSANWADNFRTLLHVQRSGDWGSPRVTGSIKRSKSSSNVGSTTDDRFRPRKVRLLDGAGPYYQVTDGVKPGEQVVVDGSFLLKTELKKTSIGAGCCGLEPVG